MTPFLGVLGCLAGAILVSGTYQLALYARTRRTEFLALSLSCLSLLLYVGCNILLYQAVTASEYLGIVRVQMVGSAGVMLSLLWFWALLSRTPARWVLVPFAGAAAIFIVARLVVPSALYARVGGIVPFMTPWGERLSTLDGSLGVLGYAYAALYALFFAAGFVLLLRKAPRGTVKDFRLALISLVVLSLAYANDVVVALANARWIFLLEIGFTASIVMMGMRITDQAAGLQRALQQGEWRYKSIFLHSSISLWEQDFSSVRAMLRELRGRVVGDLREHLRQNPEIVREAVRMTRVVDVNNATLTLYEAEDKEQLLGPLDITFSREALEDFVEHLCAIDEGRSRFERESTAQTLKGKPLHILVSSFIPSESDAFRNMLVSVIDITARKRAEAEQQRLQEELRQSQKLESVGRLAGGVAHDFNNLLTVIRGYSEVAMEREAGDPGLQEDLGQIRRASERAASLTSQLLAFSRKQVLQPSVISASDLVTRMRGMLARILGEDVEVSIHADGTPCSVLADAAQLEHVILNLAANARDAMPRGGTLSIGTAGVHVDGGSADRPRSVPDGDYVLLTVSDTGQGMAAEAMEHIFEPFFTTKERGKGTGLGLASVYGIVKQSEGFITCDSTLGAGTTFRIYLPRRGSGADQGSAGQRVDDAGPATLRGSGTILVVEDDDAVRGLALATLQRAGYTVVSARGGVEARSVLAGLDRPLDLLVTDVVMPGMGGREVADEILARSPGTAVLFMSGYAEDSTTGLEVRGVRRHLVPKPFSAATLLAEVGRALTARS